MPRRAERLLPAAYALLGLLAAGPAHGYDLHRHFAPGGPLAEVCRLQINQLYALLKKLADLGYLAQTSAEPSGAAPPRRAFELTLAGHEALTSWLDEPVRHTRDVRLEFLLKLYFARRRAPEQATALLEAQAAVTSSLVRRLERELALLPDTPDADFGRLVLDIRLRQNRAVLGWLEDTLGGAAA
ncbi:MAG: PadR family transcriptional regulator [Chloroflexia bacterium]